MKDVNKKSLQEVLYQLKLNKSELSYILFEDCEDEKASENLEVAISYMAYSIQSLKAVIQAVEEQTN